MKNKKTVLEICAFSVEDAFRAAIAGADRIEFCSGPAEGGLTPAVSDISLAKEYMEVPMFVMIRPRGGNFVYSQLEFESMKRAIRASFLCGAAGIVFGILTSEGKVDEAKCRALVEWAYPLPCVFHRAFDQCEDISEALETIIRCGFIRILTSGKAKNAEEGIEALRYLGQTAEGRIEIMAGGGITSRNAETILRTGIPAIHSSGSFNSAEENPSQSDMLKTVKKEEVRLLKKITENFSLPQEK